MLIVLPTISSHYQDLLDSATQNRPTVVDHCSVEEDFNHRLTHLLDVVLKTNVFILSNIRCVQSLLVGPATDQTCTAKKKR